MLPDSGDAHYRVSYRVGAQSSSVCAEYVEGEMYHVGTVIEGVSGSACPVSLPLLSDLLIFKLIQR